MAFGCRAHILTSSKIRVVFDWPVTDTTALVSSAYTLLSLAAPGTSITPGILSVTFYDATRRSVVVEYSAPLTFNTGYSITILGVQNDAGTTVTPTTYNFLTTVQDPPRALGAYLSIRGHIDVIFDRAVGVNSTLASANIWGPTGGPPGAVLTQIPWTTALPSNTLRFSFPIWMPTDTNFFIDLFGVTDDSFNINSETIPLTLVLRSPSPYDYAALTQVQIIDAYVADTSWYIHTSTVRVYFNCPLNYAQSINTANWLIKIGGVVVPFSTQYSVGTPLSSITSFASTTTASPVTLETGPYTYFVDIYIDPSVAITSDVDVTVFVLSEDFGSATNPLNYTGAIIARSVVNPTQLLSSAAVTDVGPTLQFDREIILSDADSVTITTSAQNVTQQVADVINVTNHLKAQFNYHASNDGGVWHSNPDITNAPIATLDATNLTDAITLINMVGAAYEAHRILTVGPVHTIADIVNAISAPIATDLPTARDLAENIIFEFSRHLSQTGVHSINDSLNAPTMNIPVRVSTGNGIPSLSASLVGAIWALNNLLFSYSYHISVNGAGHQQPDTTNVINFGDYVVTADLSAAMITVNRLKSVFTSHFQNAIFHYNGDFRSITSPDASDLPSLVSLLDELRQTFLYHDSSGDKMNPFYSFSPLNPGIHAYPGPRIYCARLFNLLKISYPQMLDGAIYTISMLIRSVFHDPILNKDVYSDISLTGER